MNDPNSVADFDVVVFPAGRRTITFDAKARRPLRREWSAHQTRRTLGVAITGLAATTLVPNAGPTVLAENARGEETGTWSLARARPAAGRWKSDSAIFVAIVANGVELDGPTTPVQLPRQGSGLEPVGCTQGAPRGKPVFALVLHRPLWGSQNSPKPHSLSELQFGMQAGTTSRHFPLLPQIPFPQTASEEQVV